jgi:hypothetical protein
LREATELRSPVPVADSRPVVMRPGCFEGRNPEPVFHQRPRPLTSVRGRGRLFVVGYWQEVIRMAGAYTVTGTLRDDGSVDLDTRPPLAAGRVRLTVEPILTPSISLDSFLDSIWEGQRARGHVPPTRRQVDDYLEAERASWDS